MTDFLLFFGAVLGVITIEGIAFWWNHTGPHKENK